MHTRNPVATAIAFANRRDCNICGYPWTSPVCLAMPAMLFRGLLRLRGLNCAQHSKVCRRAMMLAFCATLDRSQQIKRGRHALGAAPAPDFRWLPLRLDAEGRAPTEINNVKDLLLEPAMGV